MLPEEQIKNIKQQIIQQISSWQASDEQKQAAIQEIEAMNPAQLEEFLIKNKLIKTQKSTSPTKPSKQPTKQTTQECVFCSLAQELIPSFKIDENNHSIAMLEINPLTKAHTIIIPKKHVNVNNMPSSSFTLAKKVARKIKTKLKPKEINISASSTPFKHAIINVIPVYGDETGERKKADEKELKEIQKKLLAKKRAEKTKKKGKSAKASKPQIKKLPKAPIRIP